MKSLLKLIFLSSIFIFISLIFFSSCHDDKNVGNPNSHLLTIDETHHTTGATDTWIFISDESGKVISFINDLHGGVIALDGETRDDTLSLTYLSNYGTLEAPAFIISTTGGIPVRSALSMNPVATGTPPIKGTCDITLTTTPAGVLPTLSIGAAYSSFTTPQFSAPFKVGLNLFADTSSVFITAYTVAGGPVYKFLHGVGDQRQILLSYEEMKPFANTIDLPASTFWANYSPAIPGLSPETFYANSILGYPSGDYVRKIGYLPGYDRYNQYIQTQQDASTIVAYYKRGSLNTTPTIPTVSLSKRSVSLQHGDVRINRNASLQQLSWFYSSETSEYQWSTTAPYGTIVHLTALPDPLTTRYPQLRIESFQLSSVSIFESVIPWTYESFLQQVFQGFDAKDAEAYNYIFQ